MTGVRLARAEPWISSFVSAFELGSSPDLECLRARHLALSSGELGFVLDRGLRIEP